MNRLFFTILFVIVLLSCSNTPVAPPPLKGGQAPLKGEQYIYNPINANSYNSQGQHLFILAGQSNMFFLNPEVSFMPIIKNEFGAENIIVVKDSKGGEPIRHWYKNWTSLNGNKSPDNGDLYDRLMSILKPTITGRKIRTITFIWMQGESDAQQERSSLYFNSLVGLINQLKRDLGREDVNVVIGRINDHGISSNLNAKKTNWQIVRQAQVKIAESNPYYAWVNTDDLNSETDNIHNTPQGYRILGERFAKEAIQLIKSRLSADFK